MENKCSRAQIVFTIGPACRDKEILRELFKSCADVVRLNFSWGTLEEHQQYILTVRELEKELNLEIPIIQDLTGPRIQDSASFTHHFIEGAEKIVTETDLINLKFGLENGVDYVALSYVGGAKDILFLKAKMREFGREVPVIAKIERQLALDNLDEIIQVADGVMVARGDLGNEIPLEKIPFVEKEIIIKCKKMNKTVIVATQMMFSMVENNQPTRAEVTDVAFAIVNGADAVMLSDETTIGKYPRETVKIMEKIVLESEKYLQDYKFNLLKRLKS